MQRVKEPGFTDDLRDVFQGEQDTTAVLLLRSNIPETGNNIVAVAGVILRATLSETRTQCVIYWGFCRCGKMQENFLRWSRGDLWIKWLFFD